MKEEVPALCQFCKKIHNALGTSFLGIFHSRLVAREIVNAVRVEIRTHQRTILQILVTNETKVILSQPVVQ